MTEKVTMKTEPADDLLQDLIGEIDFGAARGLVSDLECAECAETTAEFRLNIENAIVNAERALVELRSLHRATTFRNHASKS